MNSFKSRDLVGSYPSMYLQSQAQCPAGRQCLLDGWLSKRLVGWRETQSWKKKKARKGGRKDRSTDGSTDRGGRRSLGKITGKRCPTNKTAAGPQWHPKDHILTFPREGHSARSFPAPQKVTQREGEKQPYGAVIKATGE